MQAEAVNTNPTRSAWTSFPVRPHLDRQHAISSEEAAGVSARRNSASRASYSIPEKHILGVAEGWDPPPVDKLRIPADVIGVKMGQQNIVDVMGETPAS